MAAGGADLRQVACNSASNFFPQVVTAAPERRPVRVLHLVLRFGFGGAELGVAKLANGADRSRFAVSVCSCSPGDDVPLAPDVSMTWLARRPGGNDWRLVRSLYHVFRREQPDIVHTHGWATLCEGWIAARLARIPIIIHGEHGTLETRRWNLLAQRWLWTRVDQVLSVSSRTAERMAALTGFPPDRIRTIRNGVDLQRFRPRDRTEARAALNLPSAPLTLGMAGRLVPVKDHHTFLSALAVLRKQAVDFAAVIVGDGPLKAQLRDRAADLGLASHVRFVDARPDIEHVLPAFDVFVSSSVSEGLSNSILEAMATGLPAVATRVGGTDELVDDGRTGLLVPAGHPDALARALRQMISNTEMRLEMGASARRRAEQEFNLERMIREYERVYLTLSQAARPLHLATA